MTMDDLAELNSLVARARRHLRDFDQTGEPEHYWLYEAIWRDLKDGPWKLELPPFKGYHPTTPIAPVPSVA